MFEYLLVIASTLIYFRVFHTTPPKTEKGTQTDPWEPGQILDLMDVSDSELNCTVQLVDWFENADSMSETSSEIELLPLVRQTAQSLKTGTPCLSKEPVNDTEQAHRAIIYRN